MSKAINVLIDRIVESERSLSNLRQHLAQTQVMAQQLQTDNRFLQAQVEEYRNNLILPQLLGEELVDGVNVRGAVLMMRNFQQGVVITIDDNLGAKLGAICNVMEHFFRTADAIAAREKENQKHE